MAETHPNALLMEASQKRLQGENLIAEAKQLEARAKELFKELGEEPQLVQPAEPEPIVEAEQSAPDGFPIREDSDQPSQEEINQTIESVEGQEIPKEDAGSGDPEPAQAVPVEVAVPTSEVPANPAPQPEPLNEVIYGGTEAVDNSSQDSGTVVENGRRVV